MPLSKRGFLYAMGYGLIAGLFLTVFFKLVESVTSLKVYTLLLNVDYIPYLNTFVFPEVIEVSFHLIVSLALAISLYLLLVYTNIKSRSKIIFTCTIVCLIIGVALYPTTTFSDRTPMLTSIPSFTYWIMGHILYGYLLGILFALPVTRTILNNVS